jgi:hypothetical protein
MDMTDKMMPGRSAAELSDVLADLYPQLSPDAIEEGGELLAGMEQQDARELNDVRPNRKAPRARRPAS